MNGEFRILAGTIEEVQSNLNEFLKTHFTKVVGTSGTIKAFTATVYVKEREPKKAE